MNVKEVMSREVRTIRMVDRLDAAARAMWEQDCGVVPVVDGNGAVVGVVTDRDVCMAAWTQGRPLGEIAVTSVMARSVRTCKPDDPVTQALAVLQQHQLHRLPVVDARGVAIGIVAINDLVRLAAARPSVLDGAGVTKALAAIVAPRKASAIGPAGAAKQVPGAQVFAARAAPVRQSPANAPPAPAAAAAPIPVAMPAIVKPAKARSGQRPKGRKS
jgi:CBS domain-containing protein